MGAATWVKNTRGKKLHRIFFSWTVNYSKYAVLTTLSFTLLRTKKKAVKKSEIWVKFFTIGCVFYRVGDWDDLQIDPHDNLHDGSKIQFAGIFSVFLEFNGPDSRTEVKFPRLGLTQIVKSPSVACTPLCQGGTH